MEIILISKEMMTDKNPTPVVYKVYMCLLLVWFLYVFILPCFYAARITSECAGKRNKLAINWSFTLAYYDHGRRGDLKPQHFNATYRNIVGSCCEMLLGTTCCMWLATLLQHVGWRVEMANRTSARAPAQQCCTKVAKRVQHRATSKKLREKFYHFQT